MPFKLIRNDITLVEADAIVNAANNNLTPGGGVCGAIFAAAGREKLESICAQIGYCETGEAVITPGFDSKAKYIIHTVGPVYGENPSLQRKQLYSCYINSMILAEEKKAESIAFPLISSGIYGYPKSEALDIAISAIRDFLENSEMTVYLTVYDNEAYIESLKRSPEVTEYIKEEMIREESRSKRLFVERRIRSFASKKSEADEDVLLREEYCDTFFEDEKKLSFPQAPCQASENRQPTSSHKRSLKELLSRKSETFSQMLLRLIDQKEMTDVEVYKRANIDRKLFSKIRKKDYIPKKNTVIALAISLRLNYDETVDLMARAGYAFSSSSDFDIIIKYFITNRKYDIYEINVTLFSFEQPLLGA